MTQKAKSWQVRYFLSYLNYFLGMIISIVGARSGFGGYPENYDGSYYDTDHGDDPELRLSCVGHDIPTTIPNNVSTYVGLGFLLAQIFHHLPDTFVHAGPCGYHQ